MLPSDICEIIFWNVDLFFYLFLLLISTIIMYTHELIINTYTYLFVTQIIIIMIIVIIIFIIIIEWKEKYTIYLKNA